MNKFQGNVSFSNLTTLQIGGPIYSYIEVFTESELLEAIKYARETDLRYLVIGGGSNLLVSDTSIEKLVIKNSLTGVVIKDDLVVVKAGTKLEDLIVFTINSSFSGMSNLIGIPGTVGGAVYGNAGAYGQTISDHLVSIKGLQGSQEVILNKNQCGFSYRDSEFKRNEIIITEVTFSLPKGDKDILQKESAAILKTRLGKYHPGIKCPGSFFKNILASELTPEQLIKIPSEKIIYGKIPAGYLLESVGAKGQRKGEIIIAPYHANLFINEGHGTAADFYNLAKTYQQKVKEKFNITLEPEVQIINLPPLG
ncbi:UDP-N-acetylenolpyruvoylglucosamine reductase [Candidatus Daviesbacteria bacterium RIFCSPLOWO2_02_FULL_40_8]|nr:MAG: UDP-N-acetylenolpyruvoylglucosamine reductase [Candidatus Daviesbacteria bacterium RIFCSPHIGHO2_02_FULL_41_14]OGE66505.1 MAG: UDP-N-acetylenolpyruvoylglucosamine reductase [Candidatus Daviesbacteria bacterium RIFCSPLOWO2_02_FULL_40_8]